MRFRFISACLAGVLALSSCKNDPGSSTTQQSSSSSGGALTIAVIPKGTTHAFWKSVEAGAKAGGQDTGASIIWKGPLKENDRAQQISIVEQFIADKVSAIVLAPLDAKAMEKPVTEAAAAKIPVIIIDSDLARQDAKVGRDFASFVATDNRKGGELAGQKLVSLLNGKGKVILLRYMVGSASTQEREEGFLSVMTANPGITMLRSDQYAGATAAEAQTVSTNLADELKKADGVFCPNESSTVGMLLALRDLGLNHKVKFVGFDATRQLVDALKSEDIDALVAQDPFRMGREGVLAAVKIASGQPVDPRIDTGVRVVTKPDLQDPAIRKLVGQ